MSKSTYTTRVVQYKEDPSQSNALAEIKRLSNQAKNKSSRNLIYIKDKLDTDTETNTEINKNMFKENNDTNTFQRHIITNEECEFSYRHSMFVEHPEYIVVFATVRLQEGNIDEIEAKMEENNASRREKQPIEYPSSGSTFKRGPDYIAAKLIDEAGLKGYKIGGAEVSTKHAGFIVNSGNATAKDVLDLIEYIKKTVYDKFGVMLQEEVVTLGGK